MEEKSHNQGYFQINLFVRTCVAVMVLLSGGVITWKDFFIFRDPPEVQGTWSTLLIDTCAIRLWYYYYYYAESGRAGSNVFLITSKAGRSSIIFN